MISITEPECPECGAEMKVVEGKYGKFYGCSNFPDCKGSVSIKQENNKQPVKDEGNVYHMGEEFNLKI
ncbi:MAG: topoisomerase DNA-binding C4 zinc finger domain-containing protein, partial [Bacteroidales bacterium]